MSALTLLMQKGGRLTLANLSAQGSLCPLGLSWSPWYAVVFPGLLVEALPEVQQRG